MSTISVRPESDDDRSGGIILSIDGKWMDPIKTGNLKWLMRKRIPVSSKPRFVYLHAKAPVSSIFAMGHIGRIERVLPEFVIDNAEWFQMTADEVKSYVSGCSTIGVLQFEKVLNANSNATLRALRHRLDYYPPQSFSFVSKAAADVIDRVCGF